MSKIKAELLAAAELKEKRGESGQELLARIIQTVSEVEDDVWEGLSTESQDWFNTAADAMNAKKTIPGFPDAEKAEEEKPARGRRGSAKEEEKAEEAEDKSAEPAVDDVVKVVTKRGKEYTGKVVEIDDTVLVIDVDGEEEEFQRDRLTSVTVNKPEGRKSSRASKEEEKPAEPAVAEPVVGDTIKAVTKRGKEHNGEVVEVEDGVVIIDVDGEDVELDVAKLESLVITKAKKAAKEKKDTKAKEPEPKKGSRTANGGISATQRMRELVCEDIEITKDEMKKVLTKEGITYRDSTLDLVYADTLKVVEALQKFKKLK